MLLIRLTILTIAMFACLPGLTMAGPTPIVATAPAQQMQRNPDLEQAVATRAQSLQSALQPEVKTELDRLSHALQQRIASGTGQGDFYPLVRQDVRRTFPRLTEAQSNLLSFYVLAEITGRLALALEKKRDPDGKNELSEMTSLRLQMVMDRESQLMATLSNILKKISSTQDDLVRNIK